MKSDKKIRVGVIGLGVGSHQARTLYHHSECELISICDFDKNKLTNIGSEFSDVKQTQNDKDILFNPDIDLVCIASYDEFHYHHQMAGGAISNLKYQLDTMGLGNRLEEILDEAGKVRADLGYPIVVSPCASYITAQALLNVLSMDKKNERLFVAQKLIRQKNTRDDLG